MNWLGENQEKLAEVVEDAVRIDEIKDIASVNWDKYLPELEAWGQSKSVKANQAQDMKMFMSKEGQAIMHAGEVVLGDFENMHWREGFSNRGYEKWVKNEDLADLLEDIYAVKEALKALTETKMHAKSMELGMATLDDPHFKKMHAMLLKDFGVKNCDQLLNKLKGIAMKLAKRLEGKKEVRTLMRKVERLIDNAERLKKTFDMPDKKDFEAWMAKNKFQPWM